MGGGGGGGAAAGGQGGCEWRSKCFFCENSKKKKILRGEGLGRGWGGGGGRIRNWGGGGSKVWGRWMMWGMGDVNKE